MGLGRKNLKVMVGGLCISQSGEGTNNLLQCGLETRAEYFVCLDVVY